MNKERYIEILEGGEEILLLLNEAKKIKESVFGKKIETCAIVNAKSGLCPSDCKFCAQSSFWNTNIKTYPLLSEKELLSRIAKAYEFGIDRFSIVTSGIRPTKEEFKNILKVIEKARSLYSEIKLCASLGQLDKDSLKALKNAGLSRYHHNLETARSFYKKICTKQKWESRYKTAMNVKEIELSLCCGGIFGLGEKSKHIIEFAQTLKEISPDSIPVNFLHPIPGTPLEKANYLTPQKCLRILIVLRLLLPDKAIRICGGREYNLRDLQAFALFPANALMVGDYLTTKGRNLLNDALMIKDLGYESNLNIKAITKALKQKC